MWFVSKKKNIYEKINVIWIVDVDGFSGVDGILEYNFRFNPNTVYRRNHRAYLFGTFSIHFSKTDVKKVPFKFE